MKPQNDESLVQMFVFPFKMGDFQVPAVSFRGCKPNEFWEGQIIFWGAVSLCKSSQICQMVKHFRRNLDPEF